MKSECRCPTANPAPPRADALTPNEARTAAAPNAGGTAPSGQPKSSCAAELSGRATKPTLTQPRQERVPACLPTHSEPAPTPGPETIPAGQVRPAPAHPKSDRPSCPSKPPLGADCA